MEKQIKIIVQIQLHIVYQHFIPPQDRDVFYCGSILGDNSVNFDVRIRRICFLFNIFIFNFILNVQLVEKNL